MIPTFRENLIQSFLGSLQIELTKKLEEAWEKRKQELLRELLEQVQFEITTTEDAATNTIRYTVTSIVHPGERCP